ncbi:MAG TPA: cellulase family glycosylhydrolase, partial [Opitutaceae bacterium]
MTWSEWRELNEQMIGIIRYYDKETVPLVAGFDWAYDLTGYRYEPIRADNIGFVSHPYSNKRTQPWEPKWEEDFGFMADSHPVIATEIGFELKDGEAMTDDSYGNRITRYLESRGISWVAWVFDPDWGPRMLKSFNGFELRSDGTFFKEAMHRAPAPIPPPPKPAP